MITPHAGAVRPGGYVEFSPTATGINAVSTKSVAITAGKLLNLSGYRQFMLILELLNTGGTNPTLGDVDITIDCWSSDGAIKLVTAKTILAAANVRGTTSGGGTRQAASVVVWDYANAGGTVGAVLTGNGTVTSLGLGCLGPVSFNLDVNAATDGTTTSVASLYVRASP